VRRTGLLHVNHLAGHAAVDHEVRAGDEPGALAIEQERDDLGHVFRPADAARRMLGVVLRRSAS
jgi:hypothetical protein